MADIIVDVQATRGASLTADTASLGRAALQIAAFTWAAEPHRFVRRIVQSVTVEADVLTTTTTYDLDIARLRATAAEEVPEDDPARQSLEAWLPTSHVVVPLVALARTKAEDIIEVTIGSQRLPVLTAADAVPIATNWLRAVLNDTLVGLRRLSLSEEADAQIVAALELAMAAPRLSANAALGVVAAQASVVLERVDIDKELRPAVRQLCERFFEWARFFAERFYLSVQVPLDDDRTTLTTRSTSHYRDEFPDPAAPTLRGRADAAVRRALGRRTPSLRFVVPQSTATDSFHLTMVMPANMHVHAIRVERTVPAGADAPPGTGAQFRDFSLGEEHLLLSPSDSAVAHAHLRSLRSHPAMRGDEERPIVRVVVNLAEDLPGSTLPALVPAVLLALLGGVLGIFLARLFPGGTGGGELSTAVPVLFLSLPTIAAVWFRSSDAGELLRRPLLSAVSPLVIGTMSAAFGFLYLIMRLTVATHLPVGWRWGWWAVTAVAVAWAGYVGWRSLRKLRSEIPTCRDLDGQGRSVVAR